MSLLTKFTPRETFAALATQSWVYRQLWLTKAREATLPTLVQGDIENAKYWHRQMLREIASYRTLTKGD